MSANESVNSKRLVKSKSGLRIIALDSAIVSPFELCEPPWTPDKESPECVQCHQRFDFIKRRHHCRRCGKVYCHVCCEKKVPLPRMCFVDPVRLCHICAEVTLKENEFFEKHLKTLSVGANFLGDIKDTLQPETFLSRLSPDHKSILFDGATKQDPIPMSSLISVKLNTNHSSDDRSNISGARLIFKDNTGVEQSLCLILAPQQNRKQSIAWIGALQKAVKMIHASLPSPDA